MTSLESKQMDYVEERACAAAISNGDFICVDTYSGYRGMQRDPQGKQHLLAPDASNEALGFALLDALAHSRAIAIEEIPAYFNYERCIAQYAEWVKNLMQRYGYKSKRALFKNMMSCGVDSKHGVITIRPSNHSKLEGWNGDGISKEDHVVISTNKSPEEIGAALRLAFSRCIG